ncbi:hypothetical protein AXG93_1154s1110 [Marchantia polymorpha subsp. ruderalis]|uniref:Uncharacterized protein n=1 Tax=Marchantia polymorpha subsp. ruderalis TaxID=1480154 RepID=A0A176WRB6_MARPO|nr:hypothetical protein AXG93_1154s1110 [Marchantia polymorpha subsp. ruderalis]
MRGAVRQERAEPTAAAHRGVPDRFGLEDEYLPVVQPSLERVYVPSPELRPPGRTNLQPSEITVGGGSGGAAPSPVCLMMPWPSGWVIQVRTYEEIADLQAKMRKQQRQQQERSPGRAPGSSPPAAAKSSGPAGTPETSSPGRGEVSTARAKNRAAGRQQ